MSKKLKLKDEKAVTIELKEHYVCNVCWESDKKAALLREFNICFDCIRQLAELIKNL